MVGSGKKLRRHLGGKEGFDFLGYHFGPDGLSLARKLIDNYIQKALRLYE